MTLVFTFAGYTFDIHSGLSFQGKPAHLQPKEKGLLQMLLAAHGQVVRKPEVLAALWVDQAASGESISRTVYRLRVAMQAVGGPEIVETVYSSGFRITVPIHSEQRDDFAMNRNKRLQPDGSGPNSQNATVLAALSSAREFLARRSAQDIEAAVGAVRLAIRLDPANAIAWSTLGEIRIFQAIRSLRAPREAAWLGKQAAQKALAIDPQAPSALAIRGWIRVMIERNKACGLQDLNRAIRNHPDLWLANLLRGCALQALGQHAQAVAMMRRARTINPVGHPIVANLALHLMLAGEMDEALQVATELADQFPTIDSAQAEACTVYSAYGRHDESIRYGWKANALSPGTPILQATLAFALASAGRDREARNMLQSIEKSGLPDPSATTAGVYLALGERDRAIAKLLDACERGIPQFAWTRDDPRLAALKGDPVVERLWSSAWSDGQPMEPTFD